MQLEQAGQQFFLNVTGPHTLEPRQGRAGHSPHMVRTRCPVDLAIAPSVALQAQSSHVSSGSSAGVWQFRMQCVTD